MPPYRQFFAGGPETVRGYRESRIGPKDSFGNPYGGNIKFTNQLELLLPMPEKWQQQRPFQPVLRHRQRLLERRRRRSYGKDGVTPVDYEFSFDKLRYSTGVAVQWMAPLGVFRFSYAVPLNEFKGNAVEYRRRDGRFPVLDRPGFLRYPVPCA